MDTGEDFKVEYLDRSAAEGIIYNDTLTIGAVQVTEQAIGGATSFGGPFDTFNFPLDGVLGLGFPEESSFQKRSVFDTMIAQGAVDHPVFGFKFTDTAGELDLGAANADLFTGDLAIVDVTQGSGHWQIKSDSLSINGEEISVSTEFIVDTSISYISLSPDLNAKLSSMIGAKEEPDAGEGAYTIDCNGVQSIYLTFAGTAFVVSPVGPPLDEVGEKCLSNFWGNGEDVARLGLPFLRNVYSVFSRDPLNVGFATLA